MSKAERISVLWFGTGSMTAKVLPAVDREYVQILAFIDELRHELGVKTGNTHHSASRPGFSPAAENSSTPG